MYDELMITIGAWQSSLNQNLALKSQYERALQDLADLLETGQEKMAGDQKIIVSSKEEIQQLLDKHKVKRDGGRGRGWGRSRNIVAEAYFQSLIHSKTYHYQSSMSSFLHKLLFKIDQQISIQTYGHSTAQKNYRGYVCIVLWVKKNTDIPSNFNDHFLTSISQAFSYHKLPSVGNLGTFLKVPNFLLSSAFVLCVFYAPLVI